MPKENERRRQIIIPITDKASGGPIVTRPYPLSGPTRLCSTQTAVAIGVDRQNRCTVIKV